ncbi:MAG: flippase [Chloroflexota bacterium]|nr:flippase [Chloroflexota bacterium]MDE2840121.1 flippase [Chloroflexota bacterium]MDE2929844.1 flippase [Chloroflexota bacterium]
MTEQVPAFIFHSIGATLALLALIMFWRLAGRAVTAETAIHAGPAFLRRIARNALVPLLAMVIARGLMWAFAAYYLRVLGEENYGYYAHAVNLIGFFGPLTDFGLGVLLTREVSRRPDAAAVYFAIVQRVRMLLSVAAIPVVLLIMAGIWYADVVPANAILTAGLLAVALIPANAAGTASSLFAARERMDYTALVQIATALFTVGLGTVAIALGWGYVGLAVTAFIANVVTAFVLLRALPREATGRAPWDGQLARTLMLASLPLMLNALLNVIFFRIDIQVLAMARDISEVGFYGAAYKYVEAFALLPSALVLALFPALSRIAPTDRAALQGIFNKALQFMLVLAVGGAVCFSWYATSFIWLIGGEKFLPHGATALAILIWFLPLSYVNAITQYVLIALDQQKWIAIAFALATAFNLITNIIFVPQYGYAAAAVTTVLSELVLLAPFFVIARRWEVTIPVLRTGWRPLLAGAGMFVVAWFTRELPALPSMALAGLIYLSLVIVLGALPREDVARFWHALRGGQD